MLVENAAVDAAVQALAEALRVRAWRLTTAESCTGGLIAAACTSLAGSSDWFDRGFVTYSNDAKVEMLDVDAQLIQTHGAVSEAVVRAMVQGALNHTQAHVAVAVSGVAGPGGGTVAKPVGLVWFAWGLRPAAEAARSKGAIDMHAEQLLLAGDRSAVRLAATHHALQTLVQRVRGF